MTVSSTRKRHSGATLEGWLETEQILGEMLELATRPLSLEDTLSACLDLILRTEWLRIEAKGGIFLADPHERRLELVVQNGLGREIRSMCALVPYGHCLCGRVAESGRVLFKSCVDAAHETHYEGMPPHGHYVVPIPGDAGVLGVVVLYLPHGYRRNEREISFLRSAANVISLIIRVKRQEAELEARVAERTAALEAEIVRREEKERALEKSESRLATLLELAPEAIILVDEEGRIRLFNRSAGELFGYAKNEIIGQQLDRLLPPALRKAHRAHMRRFFEGAEDIRLMSERGVISARRKDGSVFPARAALSKIHDGDRLTVMVLLQDITAQQEAEQALKAALEEAQAANRAKSAFLANTGHELKTPLNAVIGFSELLLQEIHGPLGSAQYHEYAELIHDRGRHLLDLITDILDIARLETAAVPLRETEVDLGAVLQEVAEKEGPAADCEGAPQIRIDVPDTLPELFADPRAVRRIFAALVSNAVKFSPQGGTVTLGARLEDGAIRVVVSDEGIGMEADDIAKILAPFAQVDSDLNRRYEGAGLGLTLARAFLEAHGGALAIESSPGRGTTVTVRFPPERTVRDDAG